MDDVGTSSASELGGTSSSVSKGAVLYELREEDNDARDSARVADESGSSSAGWTSALRRPYVNAARLTTGEMDAGGEDDRVESGTIEESV